MPATVIQPSFSSGEISPKLWGRVDLAKWQVAVATARNAFVEFEGGLSNRAGTQFVGRCKDSAHNVVCRPFTFSTVQAYMLEFGHQYMRVVMNGGLVLEPGFAISAITQAAPAVITAAAHAAFAVGDWVVVQNVAGMTEINNGPGGAYLVVSDSGTLITVSTLDGTVIDSTAFAAYTAGGTIARIFTLATPYQSADLQNLKFTQSDDVMTIDHPSYTERNLTRTAHYIWTLTASTFTSSQAPPLGTAAGAVAGGGGGAATGYSYQVTAVSGNGEESLVGATATVVGNNITAAAGSIGVTWLAAAGAAYYNVYRTAIVDNVSPPAGALFGLIGSADLLGFNDSGIIPDFTFIPPINRNPFGGGNNPGCATYYQQRLVRAGSVMTPQTLDGSQVAFFYNMNRSTPVRDDDAVSFRLVSNEVNAIKHLISTAVGLIPLTQSNAWLVNGGNPPPPFTATSILALPQISFGASDVRPVLVGEQLLYAEFKRNIIRDASFNYLKGTLEGADRSKLARHLFKGTRRRIADMAYADVPHKILWCVLDNGTAAAMTYMKDEDIYGWHRHDTGQGGKFKSVCSVSEPPEDAVYFIVERSIPRVNGGLPVKYIERLHSRDMTTPYGPGYGRDTADPRIDDATAAFFVDCGAVFGPTALNASCTPSGTSGVINLVASAGVFTAAMAGNGIAPEGTGAIVRINGGVVQVTAYTSANIVTGRVIGGPPPQPGQFVQPGDVASLVDAATADSGDWTCTIPVTSVRGLDFLEGVQAAALSGGNVQPLQTVVNGTAVFATPTDVVVVGIPIRSQVKSLPLQVQTGVQTMQSKRIQVARCGLRVENTRGLMGGMTFNTLVPFKQMSDYILPAESIPLRSGPPDFYFITDATWAEGGQMCFQQDDPLPFTICAWMPEITIGDS